MTNKNTSAVENVSEQLSLLPLGEQFRQAREKQHLTQESVAQKLLLGKQLIADIENDDYSRMVAPVYARGYVRAYAHFLKLDLKAVMQNFEQLDWCKNYAANSIKEISAEKSNNIINDFNMQWVWYTALAIFILLGVFLWQHGRDNSPVNKPVAVTITTPTAQPTSAQIATTPVATENKPGEKSVNTNNTINKDDSTETSSDKNLKANDAGKDVAQKENNDKDSALIANKDVNNKNIKNKDDLQLTGDDADSPVISKDAQVDLPNQ